MKKSTRGTLIALAVAGLFTASSAFAEGDEKGGSMEGGDSQVKCMGINGCKGQGACGTAKHDCAGKNECKGKGWIMVSAEECKEKGGTVVN